ncbi:MAG: filamentous hemagglutinin N-terminal domain-containing protein, partial [Rhodocyclaceae bacterium]
MRNQDRRIKTRPLSLLLATVGLLTLPAFAQIAPTGLPTGGVVAAGNAAISQAGAAMRVDQTSNKAVIDWQSFNIGRDASVRFYQPSASSIALNRVGADGGRSIIDGRLTANGQVWLLNPGGVLFGPTASVNVGGLLASSLKLGKDDFMSGNYRFTKDGAGSIVNQGTLTAVDGGYVALLAPEVRNEGVVAARLGTVALASGDEIRVDFAGDRLIEIKVDKAAVNGLIDNRNLVEAEGGWVLMSAGAAGDLAGGAINSIGVVQANALTAHGGVIRLEGGFVALGGTISADGAGAGTSGGTIQVTSSRDLSLADRVSARGTAGAGGSVSYNAGGRIIETSTSHTDVSGQTDGGTIRSVADGGILSSGQYSAIGATGQGGRIDLSGGSVRLLSATLDASGVAQGGLVHIGGPFQGGKAQDTTSDTWQRYIGRFGTVSDLPNTQRTFINDSTRIDVSSRVGAGGTAVVWSDAQTTFLGSISAKGGAVEISSAGDLRYVNLTGLDLGTGFLLLDPKNIVIGDFPTASIWAYQAILGKGYSSGKNVDVSSLEAGDNFGMSVSLNAAGDRLAVGSYQDGGFGNSAPASGAVRLFSFTDANFSGGALQSTLGKGYTGGKNVDVSSLEAGDIFGTSVALNATGDRLAVGAPNDDGSGNSVSNSGAVRLFSFADTNFSGGALQATIGKGYGGSKNVDVSSLEASDNFGMSVSLNATGDRLAVGAYGDDGSGNSATNSGAVHLFSFTDTNFSGGVLQGTLGKGYTGGNSVDLSSLEANDGLGISVAFNSVGDRLAVGSEDAGSGNSVPGSGAVYLFSFTDANFSGGALQATLGKGYIGSKNVDVSSLETNDKFGISVALNAAGNRLAVGAYGDDGSANSVTDSGAVRLFSFTDTNFSGGALQATLGKGYTGGKNVDVSSLESDAFGTSVALNAAGDRLAVGAHADSGSGNSSAQSGAVHLFRFTDANFSGGTLQATVGKGYTGRSNVNVGLDAGDQFGNAVSLNAAGDRLAIGAYQDDGVGNSVTDSGAVRLFSFVDTNFSGGALQATIGKGYSGGKNVDVSSLEAVDSFGNAVSLNAAGDRLAVGAYRDDGNGNSVSDSGAVHLFSFTDTNFSGGALQATLGKGYTGGKNIDVSSLEAVDYFGYSVSLNAAGDRLAVGALLDDGSGNSVSNSGAVRLFSFTDTNFSGGALQGTLGKGYTGSKNLDVSSLEASDFFGGAVSLNGIGNRLAVGAYGDAGFGNVASQSGAVRLFSFTDTTFSGGVLEATLGKGYTGGKNLDVSSLQATDYFGTSVSLNAAGDRLAVGIYLDDGNANSVTDSGAVHLYSFTDTSFSGGALQAMIGKGYTGGKNVDISSLESNDGFGANVALNGAGDRLAVGAVGDDGSGNAVAGSGAVHLFSFTDTNFSGGSLLGTIGAGYAGGRNIDVSNLEAGDVFGSAVALNAAGDRLAVGASTDDGFGNSVTDTGAVRLFSFADTNFSGGALQATLGKGYIGGKNVDVSTLESSDSFGVSVSLNAVGDRLAVGAFFDGGSGNIAASSGAVRLFSFTDMNFSGGALQATVGKGYTGGKNLDVSSLEAGDTFGGSVSLNAAGDRLAVGAQNDDGSGNSLTTSGAVHLFSFTDTNFSGGALQATLGKGYTGG